jgi:ribonuclease BN (tRNA processing enzyme)
VRLTVIGCSGSFPGPESAASCYLLEDDDDEGRSWRVLLDLGSGAIGPLQRYLEPGQIDAVLLSHLHPDHCVDLCGLYVALRYNPAGPPDRKLPVYGPADTARRMAEMYGGDEGRSLTEIYDVREWQEGEPVRIGPFLVVPRLVDHPVETYGLRIERRTPKRTAVLAYSGDTDACPALVTLAAGADLLLAEAGFTEGRQTSRHIHLTGRRAGQVATDAGVQRLLLTHLPVWTDPSTALAEARSSYPGDVSVVRAGSQYQI